MYKHIRLKILKGNLGFQFPLLLDPPLQLGLLQENNSLLGANNSIFSSNGDEVMQRILQERSNKVKLIQNTVNMFDVRDNPNAEYADLTSQESILLNLDQIDPLSISAITDLRRNVDDKTLYNKLNDTNKITFMRTLKDKTERDDFINSLDQDQQAAARKVYNKAQWQAGNDFLNSSIAPGIGVSKGQMIGMAGQLASAGIDVLDNALTGDKNFSAQSQAIDAAADGAANLANQIGSQFGPMGAAIGAGVGLGIKAINAIDKATGETVQGFDVDMKSSGYGTLGHQDSSSSRGGFLGFGGNSAADIENKLQKRNEAALLALRASSISDDISFEQEARAKSILNTITNNQIALSGGLGTDMLNS